MARIISHDNYVQRKTSKIKYFYHEVFTIYGSGNKTAQYMYVCIYVYVVVEPSLLRQGTPRKQNWNKPIDETEYLNMISWKRKQEAWGEDPLGWNTIIHGD